MAEYIDRKKLEADLIKRWNINDDQDFCNKEVWHALEEAPAADVVERKTGKWILSDIQSQEDTENDNRETKADGTAQV